MSVYNSGYDGGIKGEDMDVLKAWDISQGNGVHVKLISNGCRHTHVDFKDKFLINESYNTDNGGSEVFTDTWNASIGTLLLGVIGAAINGKGSVGVAPKASLSCNSFLNYTFNSTKLRKLIMEKSENTDIIVFPYTVYSFMSQYIRNEKVENIIDDLATKGRNNKGTVFITHSGIDGVLGFDSNSYSLSCNRNAITVSASSNRGSSVSYSSISSCISVSAPSTGYPDEITGNQGDIQRITSTSSFDDESSENYISLTHYSASSVAGVVALMLEANKDLKINDIQAILHMTASKIDPVSKLWNKNAAGYEYNHFFGFGRANASLAVQLSKQWNNFQQSSHCSSIFIPTSPVLLPSAEKTPLVIEFNIQENLQFIEFIELELDITNMSLDNTRIVLISPSGTEMTVLYPSVFKADLSHGLLIAIEKSDNGLIRLGIRSFFGEKSKGKWKMIYHLSRYNKNDQILYAKLNVYGQSNSPSIPPFVKQPMRPSEYLLEDLVSTSCSISTPNRNIACNTNVEFTTHGYPQSFEYVQTLPVYINDPKTNASHHLSLALWDMYNQEKIRFMIPCIFDEGEYFISFNINSKLFQVRNQINYINKASFGVSQAYYDQSRGRYIVKYSKKGPIRPPSYFKNVLFSFYSPLYNRTIYTFHSMDSSSHEAMIPNGINLTNTILTIQPVYFDKGTSQFESVVIDNTNSNNNEQIIPKKPSSGGIWIFLFIILLIGSVGFMMYLIKFRRNQDFMPFIGV